MANVLVEEESLGDIADAIRTQLDTEETYTPSEMADAIRSIEGGGGSMVNYSTEEQVIGTWIDGKKLYQKTINEISFSQSSSLVFSHNIENVDYIWVDLSSTFIYSDNWKTRQPWCANAVSNFYVDTSDFYFQTSHPSGKICITVRYTKTTD